MLESSNPRWLRNDGFVRRQRGLPSSLCLCLLLDVLTMAGGHTACCVPEVIGSHPGGSFVVAPKSGTFHREVRRLDRDDVSLHEAAGRWPQHAEVVELHPGNGRCDLMVFAELTRVPSGVLSGRVDAVVFCEKLRGDGLGLPGLSSCNRSTEEVAGHQGKAGWSFHRLVAGSDVPTLLSNVSLLR